MITDNEFVLQVLREGPATTMDIIMRSIRDRGYGCTPHSRVADLRRRLEPRGETIRCQRVGQDGRGRPVFQYEITPVADYQLELA